MTENSNFNSPATPMLLLLMAIAAIVVCAIGIIRLYVFLICKGVDLIMDCDRPAIAATQQISTIGV
jgi:hypothetical protein